MIVDNLIIVARNFRKKIFCLDFCFLFLCVWTLINSGSLAQSYIFKFIGSDSSTLYGSMFENAIAKMPTLNGFITNAYALNNDFNYLAAFFIVLIALCFQTSIQIFFVSMIASIIFINISDVFTLLIYGGFSIQNLVESVIANTLGSPIIAAFIVSIFYIKMVCSNIGSIDVKMRHVVSYILYALMCTFILVVSYYIVCFFYRPTTVDFSISTTKDLSGNYFIKNATTPLSSEDQKGENRAFSVFGDQFQLKNEAIIAGKIDSISSAFKIGDTYKLKLSLLMDCRTDNGFKSSSSKSMFLENVKSFTLTPSEDFSVIAVHDNNSFIQSSDEIVNMFSVHDDGKGKYSINKKNNGTINYYPSVKNASIYFYNLAIEPDNSLSTKNIAFILNVNGMEKVINIELGRLLSENANKTLECKQLDIHNISSENILKLDNAVLMGLSISIEPENKNVFFFTKANAKDSHFEIKGPLLDMTVKDTSKEKPLGDYFTNGNMDGFILHSFDKLSLNGKNIDTNNMDNVFVMGKDIYGSLSGENILKITGRASLFYRNQVRENKTLWELSSDSNIILGGVGVLLLGLLTWISKKLIAAIRKDENINKFYP